MSVWPALAFVLIAAVALFSVIAVVAIRHRPRSTHEGLLRVRQIINLARVVAAVLAIRVMFDVATVGDFGQGLALIPAVTAIIWVLGGIAGEVATRRMLRDGGAWLEVRSVSRYLPRAGSRLLALGLALTVAMAAITTWLADSSARGITFACGQGCTSTRTPWAGWFYTLPLVAAFAVLLVITAIALQLTAGRPRGSLEPDDALADDLTRTTGMASVLLAGALATVTTALGLLFFSIVPTAIDPHAPAGAVVAAAMGVLAVIVSGLSALRLLAGVLSPDVRTVRA